MEQQFSSTKPRPAWDRFWEKVDASGDCWEWTAATLDSGYGRFFMPRGTPRRHRLAHRQAWEFLVGPIPEGMEVDHLCRNPGCVNPDHLEVVTHAENTLRGYSPHAKKARQQTCSKGHAFTDDNTVIKSNGTRLCRRCVTAYARRYYQTVTKHR